MHTVVQFFCCAGQWYITVYCYKVHKIKTKINHDDCRRGRDFKVVFRNFVLDNESSIGLNTSS